MPGLMAPVEIHAALHPGDRVHGHAGLRRSAAPAEDPPAAHDQGVSGLEVHPAARDHGGRERGRRTVTTPAAVTASVRGRPG